jgi:hypothetical protein
MRSPFPKSGKGYEARKSGFKEGVEARKEGRPCKSPYLGPGGQPIKMLVAFHEGWVLGWMQKDADLREGEAI